MTIKQEKFCDEYILSGGNASAAARAAGYSVNGSNVVGNRLLARPDVKGEIKSRLDEIRSEKVVDEKELLEFLSAVIRGEVVEEIVVPSGKKICAKVNCANRLKAAETLCKIYGLFKRGDDEPKIDGGALLTETLLQVWSKQENKETAQV